MNTQELTTNNVLTMPTLGLCLRILLNRIETIEDCIKEVENFKEMCNRFDSRMDGYVSHELADVLGLDDSMYDREHTHIFVSDSNDRRYYLLSSIIEEIRKSENEISFLEKQIEDKDTSDEEREEFEEDLTLEKKWLEKLENMRKTFEAHASLIANSTIDVELKKEELEKLCANVVKNLKNENIVQINPANHGYYATYNIDGFLIEGDIIEDEDDIVIQNEDKIYSNSIRINTNVNTTVSIEEAIEFLTNFLKAK